MHLINWETVQLPRQHGGLGIKNLHTVSTSLNAKRVLTLLNRDNCLWAKMVLAKYGMPHPWDFNWSTEQLASCWKLIIHTLTSMKVGLRKLISNGLDTNTTMQDPWFFNFPFAYMPTYVNMNAPLFNLTVNDLMVGQRWDSHILAQFFLPCLVSVILSVTNESQ